MTHPNHNPFRPSGIFPSITHPVPPQPELQASFRNDTPPMKKDKEQVYQSLDPTIGASSRPPDMNMLAVDPDPQTQFHHSSKPSPLMTQENL